MTKISEVFLFVMAFLCLWLSVLNLELYTCEYEKPTFDTYRFSVSVFKFHSFYWLRQSRTSAGIPG